MANKKYTSILSSTAGIAVIAAILLLVAFIFKNTNLRIDCTGGKIFTLSNATKQTLSKLDKKITIRFYYSKDVPQMPVALKNYAQKVDDMLREYEVYSKGSIRIEKLNPKPDTDAEDSANLDGVPGQGRSALGIDEDIYLGVAIRCADKSVALPFLSPERESLLEYDLTRAIISVTTTAKHKIGIMSSMKLFGGVENPQLMMQGQGGMKPAWLIVTELKKEYNVTEIPMSAETIPEDVDILFLVHPKGITDATLFAVDQFVLRGGRLLAFIDPMSLTDMQNQSQQKQYSVQDTSSNLEKLLKAWGVGFSTEYVVLDKLCATAIRQSQMGPAEQLPNVLSLVQENLAENEPVTSQISSLLMLNSGAFTGTPAEGISKTVLVKTSSESQLLEKVMSQRTGSDMMKSFRPDNMSKDLIIRLTGKFKTAFPDGKPSDEKAEQADKADFLKESVTTGAVILAADVDMLYDPFCVRQSSIFGQKFYQPLNDNISLVQNLVESMAGDALLFEIRSKGVKPRPFTKVKEMEQAASEKFQGEILRFETEVRSFQSELAQLRQNKTAGDKELLSREQKKAVAKIRKKEAEARKNLKLVRKNMRREIESLENNVMLVNIALMPLLVVIGGICLAIFKRMRMSAK